MFSYMTVFELNFLFILMHLILTLLLFFLLLLHLQKTLNHNLPWANRLFLQFFMVFGCIFFFHFIHSFIRSFTDMLVLWSLSFSRFCFIWFNFFFFEDVDHDQDCVLRCRHRRHASNVQTLDLMFIISVALFNGKCNLFWLSYRISSFTASSSSFLLLPLFCSSFVLCRVVINSFPSSTSSVVTVIFAVFSPLPPPSLILHLGSLWTMDLCDSFPSVLLFFSSLSLSRSLFLPLTSYCTSCNT